MKQPLKFLLVALLFGSFGSVYAQQNDTIINVLSKDVVELELD